MSSNGYQTRDSRIHNVRSLFSLFSNVSLAKIMICHVISQMDV